jgi:hypothetical protein
MLPDLQNYLAVLLVQHTFYSWCCLVSRIT